MRRWNLISEIQGGNHATYYGSHPNLKGTRASAHQERPATEANIGLGILVNLL